jgi:hypothetical protein
MISFCVIDNIVCVKQEYSPEYSRPQKTVNYYPTGITEKNFIDLYGPLTDQEFYTGGSVFSYGYYQFRCKGYNFREWNKISLPELARTQAVKQEIVIIPCPKTRKGINTRWNNGRWEKELKTGWCKA